MPKNKLPQINTKKEVSKLFFIGRIEMLNKALNPMISIANGIAKDVMPNHR